MSLAAQVLQHPKINQSLAVLATTFGRDKTYRLIQYVSRILAWSFQRHGAIELASRFDALKAGLGSGRKLMRLFKPVENLQSALNISGRPFTKVSGAEQLAQLTQFGRQLCYAVFLSTDSLIWLQSVKVLRLDKDKFAKVTRVSMKAWIFGIILSLISSSASLVNLRAQSRRFAIHADAARRESEKSPEDVAADEAERRKQGRALLAQRETIMSQLVTDSFDFWIPANNLGYSNLPDGLVGLLGAITSYMALQKSWRKAGAANARKSA